MNKSLEKDEQRKVNVKERETTQVSFSTVKVYLERLRLAGLKTS